MDTVFLGIDIGGTFTKLGLITKSGEVLAADKIPTNSEIDFLEFSKVIKKKVDSFSIDKKIEAIGVGAPNVDATKMIIDNPHNLKWEVAHVVDNLSEVFDCPVKMDNDANIAAVGEKVFGVARDLENFIILTIGTGLGSGVFIGNKLYQGPLNMGSEAGHMPIIPDGRLCSCGSIGHVEAYCSASGIRKTYKEIHKEDKPFREIVTAFKCDDPKAVEAVRLSAKYFAIALSGLNAVLMPEAFIFSGGGAVLGTKFLVMLAEEYQMRAYPHYKDATKFYLSSVSAEHGAILGAASLVIHE